MTTPVATPLRLQLSRRKGFNLQAHSKALNGLECVNCARPGVLGNPFVIGEPSGVFPEGCGMHGRAETLIASVTREQSIEMFTDLAGGMLSPEMFPHGHQWMDRFRKVRGWNHPTEYIRVMLKGRNLACSCDLCPTHKLTGKPLSLTCTECAPCHCDVLGEIANR